MKTLRSQIYKALFKCYRFLVTVDSNRKSKVIGQISAKAWVMWESWWHSSDFLFLFVYDSYSFVLCTRTIRNTSTITVAFYPLKVGWKFFALPFPSQSSVKFLHVCKNHVGQLQYITYSRRKSLLLFVTYLVVPFYSCKTGTTNPVKCN